MIEGVLCQKLLPAARSGRVIAVEVMIATDAIRNQIRESQSHQIATTIEASGRLGMQTMDRAIVELCKSGQITRETALLNCMKTEEVSRLLGA